MEKYDITEIAKWILKKEDMVTHKRLQKYLYFLYGEFLAQKNSSSTELNVELFHNDFEGWAHGPVSPTIYALYKNSGYKPLSIHPNCDITVSQEDEELLNKIHKKYIKYTTDELEKISHQQIPWRNSRKGLDIYEVGNKPLNTIDIYECFKHESKINY